MDKELEEWYKLHKFHKYSDYLTKDLADFLKVSPRTIQRWIKGKAKPNKKKLLQIGRYLAGKTP
jgi:transcriptional regulator with XRE-family HTH domain